MSDYLVIRGMEAGEVAVVLAAWAEGRAWVHGAEVRAGWEAGELVINGKGAVRYLKGKHREELAALAELVKRGGGSLVHVMLRGKGREEVELAI